MKQKHFLVAAIMLLILLATMFAEAATGVEREIYKQATSAGLNPELVRSIFMQESSLRVSAVNRRSNDYGIGQINEQHVQRLGLSKKRLTNDVHYSVAASIKLLLELKAKYGTKEPHTYWTRYHSFRPSLRAKYKTLVLRHYRLAYSPYFVAEHN